MCPDIHLRRHIIDEAMKAADVHRADFVVFLGDYFDDWGATPSDYRETIKTLQRVARDPRTILLLGNHELSYMGFPCSGHNLSVAAEVRTFLKNDLRFIWTWQCDNVLYSHAGVTASWLDSIVRHGVLRKVVMTAEKTSTAINNIEGKKNSFGLIYGDEVFAMVGPARGGNSAPSPLWADMDELLFDHPITFSQVVGHTPTDRLRSIFWGYKKRKGFIHFMDWFSNKDDPELKFLLVKNGVAEEITWEMSTTSSA